MPEISRLRFLKAGFYDIKLIIRMTEQVVQQLIITDILKLNCACDAFECFISNDIEMIEVIGRGL